MEAFDLNIEEILETWEPFHAVREIIANALDEQTITETKEVEIYKDKEKWHVRDFGRGLKYQHLTQNESVEKLSNPKLIGKFGVGLKDALATFHRQNIGVLIRSKYCEISTKFLTKAGFKGTNTLHALISPASDPGMKGTEFIFDNLSDNEMKKAKELFLRFTNEQILERTSSGQVIQKANKAASIYISGLKIAEEPNFLFSYNIASVTKKIKEALNRERNHVGRGAYSDSVKKILLESNSNDVSEALANDLTKSQEGTDHEESRWIDIQEHSVKTLNQSGKYLFVTQSELRSSNDHMDQAEASGKIILVVPETLRNRFTGKKDFSGNPILGFNQYLQDYNDNFDYDFIKVSSLDPKESFIYSRTQEILDLFGGKPEEVEHIRISSRLQKKQFGGGDLEGVWDADLDSIIIHRDCLKSLATYSGVLIHEAIHAKTGFDDATRDFEDSLTETIGNIAAKLLRKNNKNSPPLIEKKIVLSTKDKKAKITLQIDLEKIEKRIDIIRKDLLKYSEPGSSKEKLKSKKDEFLLMKKRKNEIEEKLWVIMRRNNN